MGGARTRFLPDAVCCAEHTVAGMNEFLVQGVLLKRKGGIGVYLRFN